ncbi:MAG: serine/threonine protein kinase, partial [Bacteroidetes bacterium]|nr:serine/threonine protein kinase [Bacteroidota bacterium]
MSLWPNVVAFVTPQAFLLENPARSAMIGKTVSHYTLGSELGRGGMGVVYRAKDSTLDRTVAIKFLASELTSNATARERFIREAKAAAAIEHQSICSIHEIAETEDGATYIVMPYYEGLTLKELIATGKQAPSKALDIGKQVASGLAAAHDKGVIHRDIKPGNVMLTTRNRAIILDFGLAKLGGGSDLTRSRSSVGTLPYMAPEQLRGEKVDQRTDIWGLGTVLYEMVSGQRPFQGEYDAAVTYSILNVDPTPLDSICDDLPEGFCNIIERCLAKNPEDRYQTAEELLVDLERPDSSVPFVATGPPRKTVLRFNRPTILAIFSLVLLVLVLVTILRPNDAAETGTKHLAILEFEVKNPDQDEDLQAFSDGVRSVIISHLSKLQWLDESLTMVPMSPYDSPSSVADAQDRYGASHVLTTEVEEQELGTQITFTLIDVLADTAFTSESLTYTLNAAASFPSDAFRSITRLLNIR